MLGEIREPLFRHDIKLDLTPAVVQLLRELRDSRLAPVIAESLGGDAALTVVGDGGILVEAEYTGLQIALYARNDFAAKVRAPCFCFVTVKNQGKKGRGGQHERGSALLLHMCHHGLALA